MQDLRISPSRTVARAGADAHDRRDGRARPWGDDGDLRGRRRRVPPAASRTRIRASWFASTPMRRRSNSRSPLPTTWRSREQQTHFDQVARVYEPVDDLQRRHHRPSCSGTAGVVDLFHDAGHHAGVGPGFSDADGRPGNPQAVIVTHGFWQQRLGGQPMSSDEPIRLDGADYVLRGRAARRSLGPLERGQEFFVAAAVQPAAAQGSVLPIRQSARLKSESDRGPAADELRAINKRIFPIWKVSYQDDKATWSMMDLQHLRRRRHANHCRARAGRGRAGVADRLHQRVQSADRTRHQPPARARRSRGARRIARSRHPRICWSKARCSRLAP